MKSIFLSLIIVFITFMQIICTKNETIVQKSPEILFCNANREIRIVSLNESLFSSKPKVYKRQTRTLSRRRRPKPRALENSVNGCNNDIDYDFNDNYLIWSNISSIIIAPLDRKSKNALNINSKKVLLKTNEVQRLSLDWIHDLLYYIESGELKVINVKNQKLKTIGDNQHSNGDYKAMDVVVNPIESFIAWLRWDRRSFTYKVMKAEQNGDNPKILVDLGFYGTDAQGLAPCCLSIDYESKRLYFVDNKMQTLESVLFDGTKRSTHLHTALFAPTSSIDIYGDYVFWSNRGQSSIYSANKYGKSANIKAILRSEHNIDSIRILHSSKQPLLDDRCRSAKCTNLCIPLANDQHICVCDNESKRQNKNICNESHFIASNLTINSKDKKVEEIHALKVNEIQVTENFAKTYPLYVFKCETNFNKKSNDSFKIDWFTSDDRRLVDKLKKSPLAKNITKNANSVEMIVSYPYIKLLDKFKCKASVGDKTYEELYKVVVRQLPPNPKILSHSLSFANLGKVYITLQIENPTVEPPVDKYRIAYRGIFNYYQQEYWLDFNALSVNPNDKNTVYVIKLDVDYTTQDLMAFKLYAHNDVGWSYPVFN